MISISGIILPYFFHACHRPLTRKCDLPVNTTGGISAAMFILIDNYDSFTWNLWHFLSDLGAEVEVIRNDAATVDEIMSRAPQGLILSPGPGMPETAGISVDLISAAAGKIPVLGVCLGH